MPYNFEKLSKKTYTDGFFGDAKIIELKNTHGMTIVLTDIGASWLSCVLPLASGPRDVILNSPNLTEFKKQTAYFGMTVGRFANRLANGQFMIGDKQYQLTKNEGVNTLHGGYIGLSHRRWDVKKKTTQSVTFSVSSPDGEEGFPGNFLGSVCYTLTNDNEVLIEYKAVVDKTCPINLTNHAYFNLAGEDSFYTCLSHYLQLDADTFLRVDQSGIPTGEWVNVINTHFDFLTKKRIECGFLKDKDQELVGGYDHAFIINQSKTDGHSIAASLFSPNNDVRLDVSTTMPSIQLYTGNFLKGEEGKTQRYKKHAGIALETQFLPDGPNQISWNEKYRGILSAGTDFESKTCYRFTF